MPLNPDDKLRDDDFQQESDISADQTNDAEKVAQKDSDGLISGRHLRTTEVYDTPGTYTWEKPKGINWVYVEMWGGGGSGGVADSDSGVADGTTAYGGSGGEYNAGLFPAGMLPDSLDIVVGAGGEGDGNDGGDSKFGTSTVFMSALGGAGGNSQGGGDPGANPSTSGGTQSSYDHKKTEEGEEPTGDSTFAGAGGGGRGQTSSSGGTASQHGGDGGDGKDAGFDVTESAEDGQQPGGGGGGIGNTFNDNSTLTSGKGGDGKVIVSAF